jgi:hypothetical protein
VNATPKKKSILSDGLFISSIEPADDEFKQLKEFKNFISAKSEPVSVKIVYYTALCLVVLLFVLCYLSFSFILSKRSMFKDAMDAIDLSQRSSMAISE